MLVLKKVAITGGLSSGKSSVCKLLKKHGAYIVSADEIVHQLLSPQTKVGQNIVKLLGKEIVSGKQFDRAIIAKKVFTNKQDLKALEQILHPAVLEEIEKQYKQVKDLKQYTLFIAEVPLLYESESEHFFDIIIAVIADEEIAKNRFFQHTRKEASEFDQRMAHQISPQQKAAKADYTIVNNGNFPELEKQVEILYSKLLSRS